MCNDLTFSRRALIAGLAAAPTFSVTIAVAHIDIALIALGRKLNVASQPPELTRSSAEWPNAETTGVSAGTTLTDVGSFTSSSNKQIIEGLNVNGTITISHAGVVIRKCRMKNMFINSLNCTVEGCDVVGGSWNSGINILANDCIVRGCNISGVENGFWLELNGCLIVDNYIHDLADSAKDPHFDGLQIPASASPVSNNVIRHNNFDLQSRTTSSCITMKDASNINIDSNRLNGGTYCIYFEGNTKGCNVTNNYFVGWTFGRVDGKARGLQTYAGNFGNNGPLIRP